MSLLRRSAQTAIEQQALRFEARLGNALRAVQYGQQGDEVPAGMVDVRDEPQGPEILRRFLEKQARREQEGFAQGDLGTAATEHPAVREELMEPEDG